MIARYLSKSYVLSVYGIGEQADKARFQVRPIASLLRPERNDDALVLWRGRLGSLSLSPLGSAIADERGKMTIAIMSSRTAEFDLHEKLT